MSLTDVPGQARAKRFLKRLVRTGHVPHALLFSGMAGVGKKAMALELAKLMNCPDAQGSDGCDGCPSCRKIAGGNHPDFLWIKSEGAYIKLDQIRELRDRLRYRPFEGLWRVVVIEDAHSLKEEAGNALLKILEEPPKQNLFILTTLEPQMLLSTIVSRCCHVRFQPLDDSWIENHMASVHQMDPLRAREIARLAEGSLDRAQWLAAEDRVAHWKQVLEGLQTLDELPMIDFFAMTSRWAQQSEDLEQDLECIKLWMRDLILSRLTEEHCAAMELDAKMRGIIESLPIDTLFQLYEKTEQAMQHLRQNANKQLTLEGLCLAIKDDLYGKGSRNPFSQRRQNLLL